MYKELDRTDLAILSALQENADTPQSNLGREVGLSAAAVNRRIQKLTTGGFIERTTSKLSKVRLGFGLTIVTLLEVESEQKEKLQHIQSRLEESALVQTCYYVTGEWDFVLIMVARTMDEYIAETRDLFLSKNFIKKFKTLVVMDVVKESFDLPIKN